MTRVANVSTRKECKGNGVIKAREFNLYVQLHGSGEGGSGGSIVASLTDPKRSTDEILRTTAPGATRSDPGLVKNGALLSGEGPRDLVSTNPPLAVRCANSVATAVVMTLLKPLPLPLPLVTADNGKEFSHHERIAQDLQGRFFFAHP